MRTTLVIAAGLFVVLAVAHSVLGERYILIRLFRRDNLPKIFGSTAFTTRTLRFAWHITSVLALGFAAILWLIASPNRDLVRPITVAIAATSLACGLLSLTFSRGRHLSWIVFFAIAVLGWIS